MGFILRLFKSELRGESAIRWVTQPASFMPAVNHRVTGGKVSDECHV
jgi:hypothetical protein